MRRTFLIIAGLCFTILLQAQVSKTLNVTAGGLSTSLTVEEKNTVTNLTLTGLIDARDFRTMRDNMAVLAELDLTSVTIAAYNGPEGTSSNSFYYNADVIPDYAFYNSINFWINSSLTSIILPSSTTAIGNYAFYNCTGLSGSLSISSLVKTIGNNAFTNCDHLTSINIPASVISIGSSAFTNSTGFISVDADNPNYSSADGVLFNKTKTILIQCTVSKSGSYSIPSSVTLINTWAFNYCKNLTSVNIPSSVTSFESYAFYYCSGLTSVTIPSSVTFIGYAAFYGCSGLVSITIPSTVTSINQYAFAYCTGLTSVTGGWSVPIDLVSFPNVFKEVNKSICILHVPYKTASRYAVANQWQDFANIVEETNGFNFGSAKANIEAAEGSTTTIDITANVNWTASSDQTWLTVSPTSGTGNQTLTFTAEANPSIGTRTAKVTVSTSGVESQPITVTQTGADVPLNITAGGLKTALTAEELALTKKLTLTGTMDARDFKVLRDEMPLLAELDLSGISIATYTGTEGTAGTSIIEYPADAIPDYAFLNSTTWKRKISLTSVVLPSELFTIGRYALYGCSGLTSFTIPSSVITIGVYALYNCSGLTSITIPSSVTAIGNYAFNNCKSLLNVDSNNLSFSSIDGVLFNKTQSALIQCPISITGSYSIPSSVTSIGNGAFEYCSKLTSITIPSSVTSIGDYALYGCNGLTSVSIPMSVTTIGNGTFKNCSGLITVDASNPNYSSLDGVLFNKTQSTLIQCPISKTSYSIPSSVTSIGYSAFETCNKLTTISIPLSVSSIGPNAFRYCYNLTSIYTYSPFPIWLDPFMPLFDENSKYTCRLYVPYGSYWSYKNAFQWKNFMNILEMPLLKLSATTASLTATQGSTATAELTTNTTWTASSNQTWLAVSPTSATGNQTLTFTAEANPTTATRVATVLVTSGGITTQTVIITQEAGSNVTQSISLNAGWNIISLMVMPDDPNLKNILQPQINESKLKKVMDESGKVIEDWGYFGGWQNTIVDAKNTEGYKINVASPTTVEVTGIPTQLPFDIALNAGWNIVSWPSPNEQGGMAVFQPLIDAGKLKKVMDESGKVIEDWGYFGGWQNTIGNLKPGEGYKVNVTGDCTLTINESGTKSEVIIPELIASTHFVPAYKGNGTDHMNINLLNLAESGIRVGDEIGIFDGDICVGSAKISNLTLLVVNQSSISLPVSAADGIDGKNGYSEGNPITLKLFRNGKEYPLTIQPLNQSKTVFEKGSSLFAQVGLVTDLDGLAVPNLTEINCYPNPFSDEITVEINLAADAQVQVEVLNQLGQRVKMITTKQLFPGGLHKLEWDSRNSGNGEVTPGIYHVRIEIDDLTVHRKIVLSK